VVVKSQLVLVVDDEPHLCNVLRRILNIEGYKVITALDGKKALRLIKEKGPDIILLDIGMPGMNGREVCRRARELSPTAKIIYFTGRADPVELAKLRELHGEVDAFVAKPATGKQILSAISGVLPRKGR
jgi:DNA-binding response OmpR family regulator